MYMQPELRFCRLGRSAYLVACANRDSWIVVYFLAHMFAAGKFDNVCSFRLEGLAYVVAFANRGAKDVTQRYVASALAADKLRDNAWWEETLKPLRKHEASALHLHSSRPAQLWL